MSAIPLFHRPSQRSSVSRASGAMSVMKLKSRSSFRRLVSPTKGETSVTRLLRRTSVSNRWSSESGVRSETWFSPRSRRTKFSQRSRPSKVTISRPTASSSVSRRRSEGPMPAISIPSASRIAASNRESANSIDGVRAQDASSTATIATTTNALILFHLGECSTNERTQRSPQQRRREGNGSRFVTLPPKSRRRRSYSTAHLVPYGKLPRGPRASVG